MERAIGKYCQGYKTDLTKREKRQFLEIFHEKSLWKGILLTLVYLLTIYSAIAIFYNLTGVLESRLALGSAVLICIVFVTRQMRALENIVHFGSHNNFCRERRLNNFLTNLLAAWPMLQDVCRYRDFHKYHHGIYGSDEDPCKVRFRSIGAGYVNISTNAELIFAILRWMPSYVREFYREVKSNSTQVVIFIVWHAASFAIIAISVSWQLVVFVLAFWVTAMFGFLPFLRSIAEFSEHDYERGDSVRETTFNNLGLIDHLILHPAGDAWHALHHLHPTVPWWQQRAAHRYLIKHDAAYRAALHRDSLFQSLVNFPSSLGRGSKEDRIPNPESNIPVAYGIDK